MKKAKLKRIAKETIDLVNDIVSGEVDIPNNALVLEKDSMIEIFTKKRLELIELIKEVKPKSIQELALITKRKKQAVDRDLKLLERHEIIGLRKNGRCAIPFIRRKILVMPLVIASTDKYQKEDVSLVVVNKIRGC